MIKAEQPLTVFEPGTPLIKVVPPRLVEPYLTGQRSVIAGYLYRARDCEFGDSSEYYRALALGYDGSDFSPGLTELYLLRWAALDMSASLVGAPSLAVGGQASSVPEFFTLPVPIPVGAEMSRLSGSAEEFVARYDGQVWLRPLRGEYT